MLTELHTCIRYSHSYSYKPICIYVCYSNKFLPNFLLTDAHAAVTSATIISAITIITTSVTISIIITAIITYCNHPHGSYSGLQYDKKQS